MRRAGAALTEDGGRGGAREELGDGGEACRVEGGLRGRIGEEGDDDVAAAQDLDGTVGLQREQAGCAPGRRRR